MDPPEPGKESKSAFNGEGVSHKDHLARHWLQYRPIATRRSRRYFFIFMIRVQMFVDLSPFNQHVIMAAHNRNVFSLEQLKWYRGGA